MVCRRMIRDDKTSDSATASSSILTTLIQDVIFGDNGSGTEIIDKVMDVQR